MLLGPVQPSLLLSLSEEGLLGSTSAWHLQHLVDNMTDGLLGDIPEPWNFLLEASSCQERVSLELLLHLSLDNIRNFAVVAARTRIRLPLGWPGQATVSGSVPGASFLGILLSVTECPGRYLQVPGHMTRRHTRLQHVQGRDCLASSYQTELWHDFLSYGPRR